MFRSLRTAGLLLAWAFLSACSEAPTRLNVLVISVDTLRRDALPAPGRADGRMPNLQALADRARVFEGALAPASWTLPSHASLFTGVYPDRHGATDLRLRLGEEFQTLAEAFRDAGYRTVAFTDGGFLRREYGLDRGFERYDQHAETADGLALPREGAPSDERGRELFDRGLAFVEQQAAAERPFFLFLHTYAVHDYSWLHSWIVPGLERPPTRRAREYADCLVGRMQCSNSDWRILEDLYRLEVANLDRAVGRLIATLDRTGLAATTLVVVLSDHGEGFAPELGRIGHGGRLHGDQLNVPLWFAGPGVATGLSREPVSLVDLKPTLAELLGVGTGEALDGVSFAPALRGEAIDKERALLAMEYYYGWRAGERVEHATIARRPLAAAVMRGHWSLLFDETGGGALFANDTDPKQLEDVAPKRPESADLQRLLDRRLSSVSPPRELSVEDPRLRDELRALGYVQ